MDGDPREHHRNLESSDIPETRKHFALKFQDTKGLGGLRPKKLILVGTFLLKDMSPHVGQMQWLLTRASCQWK